VPLQASRYLQVLLPVTSQPWLGPVASAQATVERANATTSKVNRARIRDM